MHALPTRLLFFHPSCAPFTFFFSLCIIARSSKGLSLLFIMYSSYYPPNGEVAHFPPRVGTCKDFFS